MFKGLGAVNFSYSGGTVTGSNGWSYPIRARFDSQMAAQPQYKSIADGYVHLANMAIGLADDNYRSLYGVMPGTNQSEFGQWIDGNRQAVYADAQGWFTYVPAPIPPVQPPITTQPTGETGTPTNPFPGTTPGGGSGSFSFPGGMTMWIIGGLALFLMMKD
jgi:hypothetical protein